ncbi:nicotianamine aminotransferase 1 isoform X2 [Ricinus communis]|uniref:nicotianamine aminotransferase 1 isoform X2 n=1 Tax=Ricinus communis TaxID=3988 RepID=UPI000D68D4DC|nr:nicotianamine aminotransferase 1 isoform X2 [Ricinus communis]|eukprot:XP_025012892.1 probable aminotransferase TAT2 isoform X2 [Ricinus communis]
MENGVSTKWGFRANEGLTAAAAVTVRGVLDALNSNLNKEDERTVIPLGHGDPSAFPSFLTASAAEDAIVDALKSAKYNCYSPTVGLLPARRAIADYLNIDLPYELSPDDVFVTLGCTQAIEVSLTVLGRPGANILLPRPGFPYYTGIAAQTHLEVRHFDLLPEKGWEVNFEAVEALADENTAAMVIINPGNPCGNVYSYEHLKKIAETARKLGILVIADEVYAHLTFGSTPFVPMGVFGSVVPVLTLGSISKRWIVPGWRLGWLVLSDPKGILQETGVVDSITSCLNISSDPATFIQEAAELCYDRIQDIPCITCLRKPEGSMFLMAKLNLSSLKGIEDDMDFCLKLAKEESVIVLPGITVGLKNWLRITFAIELSTLEVGLGRIRAFYERHAKKQ